MPLGILVNASRPRSFCPAKSKGAWSVRIPIRANGLLVASDSLYVAGTRDVVEKDDPWAHVEGRKGGVLAVYSKANGEKLADYRLDAPPVFDGLAAAGGRLYLTAVDGRVVCMAGE